MADKALHKAFTSDMNHDNIEPNRTRVLATRNLDELERELLLLERRLIPLLNRVREVLGKPPMYPPQG